ncbi:MAG TPA: DUF3761 domain-containing protein [Caldimonas sp.]|nr:DUF3761 domain-containing protein [Caldimonas sp.]
MKTIHSLALAIGLFASGAALAQAPAGAPAGSTAQCKDGTYTSTDTKKGACSGHKGVKEWYGEKAAAPAKSTTAAVPAAEAKSDAKAEAKATKAEAKSETKTAAKAPAAGGGAGQVWVNTESKVYHCPGTHWYGKTKQGEYMTESAAKAAGNRADHGKACAG